MNNVGACMTPGHLHFNNTFNSLLLTLRTSYARKDSTKAICNFLLCMLDSVTPECIVTTLMFGFWALNAK